eukprot:5538224-Prymnesium_polylepis.1
MSQQQRPRSAWVLPPMSRPGTCEPIRRPGGFFLFCFHGSFVFVLSARDLWICALQGAPSRSARRTVCSISAQFPGGAWTGHAAYDCNFRELPAGSCRKPAVTVAIAVTPPGPQKRFCSTCSSANESGCARALSCQYHA